MRTFVTVVLAAAGFSLAACGTTDRGLDAKTQADQISTQINEQVKKANSYGEDQQGQP